MSEKRSYKQYSREFKEEAVALVLKQGYSVPKAAESLRINSNMLYKWKEKFEIEPNVRVKPYLKVSETSLSLCAKKLKNYAWRKRL